MINEHKRLHKILIGMKQRCNNKNDKDYYRYGGRGIKVCEEWNSSTESFVEWALNNGYSDNLSIDRIDVNGDYTPSNCKWATSTEQVRNRRLLKNNKSGHNGIYFEKERNKYRVTIYCNNKKIDLGRYDTIEEAICARKNGEIKYWKVGA